MLSRTSRRVGLGIAVAMFFFSAAVYLKSGDWVAAVFALGSIAYALFFLTTVGGDS